MTMQQVNLYHPIFRKEQKRFSSKAMVQAGAGVLLGTLVMYAYASWQVVSLRGQVTQAAEEQQQAHKRLEVLNQQLAARRADGRIEHEVRDLEMRLAAAERVGQMIAGQAMTGGVGYSKYFVAFARQHVPGVWLTRFTVTGAGEDIELSGRTTNPELVPTFLQRLSQEEILSGARFQVFQMQRPAAQNAKAPDYLEFSVKTSDREDEKVVKKQ